MLFLRQLIILFLQLLVSLLQLPLQFLIGSHQTHPLFPQLSLLLTWYRIIRLVDSFLLSMSQIVLVLDQFPFQMFEIHLDFLFQSNMTPDGGLQLLSLSLQSLITIDTDKIGLHKLNEVVHHMISQQGWIVTDAGIVTECRQSIKIKIRRKCTFKGIQYKVTSTLKDLL